MIEELLKKTPAFIWPIKHWYLMTEAWDIDQICKQTVTISVFWALEALFVDEKSVVVNENDRKMIEEDSSFHFTYQTLMSDTFFINKQGLKSYKDRNRDCLFTNLINYYRYKSSDINVWYVKWKLEFSSTNFLSFSFTATLFSSTNKASRAQKTEIVTVCLQIWSISQASAIRYQCW